MPTEFPCTLEARKAMPTLFGYVFAAYTFMLFAQSAQSTSHKILLKVLSQMLVVDSLVLILQIARDDVQPLGSKSSLESVEAF